MKKPKKFDAVQMMREIRDRMSADMQGMGYQEQIEYIEKRAEIVRKELKLDRFPRAA